jgi:hypothetical protein
MIQYFGSSGEASFAGATLWIQTLESLAETKTRKARKLSIPISSKSIR